MQEREANKGDGNLMPNIPQYLVQWSIEDIMEGYCQLDNSEAWTKVTPSSWNIEDDIRTQLFRELFQLLNEKAQYIDEGAKDNLIYNYLLW